ncbi:MAG TPA: protease HtpX [Usitatibacter sp.]|nr:protease HtpX [Usitatibacter sp.]
MKRLILFFGTNIAVMVVLTIVTQLLGVDRWLYANGINYFSLLAFCAIFGFGGAFISLLLSKTIAKYAEGVQVIDGSGGADEQWLVNTVRKLADKAGVGMPEVGIFQGAPNAFATGAFRNHSLVAVSTGLLQSMTRDEVEAVLGHEMAHVANGDMVTLTLIQGVVNTFVMFLSRVIGTLVDRVVFRTERGIGPGYYLTVMVCQLVFGIIASLIVAWFSRRREFRADAGSAEFLGDTRPMISALRRLGGQEPGQLAESLQAFGIAEGGHKFLGLFASHPPIPERIAALEARRAR